MKLNKTLQTQEDVYKYVNEHFVLITSNTLKLTTKNHRHATVLDITTLLLTSVLYDKYLLLLSEIFIYIGGMLNLIKNEDLITNWIIQTIIIAILLHVKQLNFEYLVNSILETII